MSAHSLPEGLAERMLDGAGIGLWLVDANAGTTVYANRRFQELCAPAAEAPAHVAELALYTLSGAALAPDAHPFTAARALRRPYVLTAALDPAQTRVARFKATPLEGDDGSLTHILIAVVDASEKEKAERAGRVATERLRAALDHAPIIVWAVDANGVVTLSEGAALAGLGVKPGELVGRNVFDLYAADPVVSGHVRRALEGESFSHESRIGASTLDTWTGPLLDETGAITGAIGVSTDVTARTALQAKTIQADRIHALGTLAASIAHEINNPLAYAMLSAELVGRCLAKASAAEQDPGARNEALADAASPLAQLQDGLKRISVVTGDMRSFSRPQDAVVLLDLPSAIRQTLQLVSKNIDERAELELDLRDVPVLFASEARLGQVVLNLLVNATQSIPAEEAGHIIYVETRTEARSVLLAVEDTGPGIPEELRERVFEPFFTTRPVGVGTGLGLFVCRNIVRGYGGTLTLSEGRRGGARFEIRLPIASPSARLPTKAPAGTPAADVVKARILVIDDDKNLREAFVHELAFAGHTVHSASSGEAGLERLLSDDAIDLCFCDLMMRGMSGVDVFRRAVAARESLGPRIVLMSGGAFTPEARQFVEAHVELCIEKPFDIVAESARRLSVRSVS